MEKWKEDIWERLKSGVLEYYDRDKEDITIKDENGYLSIKNKVHGDWEVLFYKNGPDRFIVDSAHYVGDVPDTEWEYKSIRVSVREHSTRGSILGDYDVFLKYIPNSENLKRFKVDDEIILTSKTIEEVVNEEVDRFLKELNKVKLDRWKHDGVMEELIDKLD